MGGNIKIKTKKYFKINFEIFFKRKVQEEIRKINTFVVFHVLHVKFFTKNVKSSLHNRLFQQKIVLNLN